MSRSLTDEELNGHARAMGADAMKVFRLDTRNRPGVDKDTLAEVTLKALSDVAQEFSSANLNFGTFSSSHEGSAVLKEEVDELWDVVKTNPRKIDIKGFSQRHYLEDGRSKTSEELLAAVRDWQDAERTRRMRKEAIQVAAMALRFVVDVCDAPPAKTDPTAAPAAGSRAIYDEKCSWPTPAPKPEAPAQTPPSEPLYVVRIAKTYPGDDQVYAEAYDGGFTCSSERVTMTRTEARKLRDEINATGCAAVWKPKVRRARSPVERKYVVRVASLFPGDPWTYVKSSAWASKGYTYIDRSRRPTMSLADAQKLRDTINAHDGERLMPRVQRARA